MENNPNQNGNSRFRINSENSEIVSENGDFSLSQDQIAEITESGHVITTGHQKAIIINGEAISHASQIRGECQNSGCQVFVTERTIRYCFYCGEVNCGKCIKWDNRDQLWVCQSCRKSIRWRRFWVFLGRLVILPFVLINRRRHDN